MSLSPPRSPSGTARAARRPRPGRPDGGGRPGIGERPDPGGTLSSGGTLGSGRTLGIGGRLVLLHVLVLTLLTLLLGAIEVAGLRRSVQDSLSQRALDTSRLVAQLPTVRAAAQRGVPDPALNRFVNRLKAQLSADFIVVGDRRGIRLAHPTLQALGQPMQGGDNLLPFRGREVVSLATGSLGYGVRGKVPIFGLDGSAQAGQVVGVVSTGYLMPRVRTLAAQVVRQVAPWFVLALLLGTLGSVFIARRFKRDILNLEPEQIAALVQQHRAVLAALREGVIAVDPHGCVTLTNPHAAGALHLEADQLPAPLSRVWPELAGAQLGSLEAGSSARNLSVRLRGQGERGDQEERGGQGGWGGQQVLVNVERLPGGGFVASFRDRAEVLQLAEELTQVRGFVDVLRAQTHEHLNRMHTISGLLQLDRPGDALRVVRQEVARDADLREMLLGIRVPRLAALLTGKRERAAELGLGFVVEPGANLGARWETVGETLLTAAGNLIENAFDALRAQGGGTVTVAIGEDPDGAQLEVMDDGPGVAPELGAAALDRRGPEVARLGGRLFESGVSSKGEGRGYGLANVRASVTACGGQVRWLRRADCTVFQVSLPASAAGQRGSGPDFFHE